MQISATLSVLFASIIVVRAYTELSPKQTSEIRAAFETLMATRADVKSVQSAVRSEIPKSYFDDDKIGPFYQTNLASLEQAATPKFTQPVWLSQLDPALRSAYKKLEPDALKVEKSLIESVLHRTSTTTLHTTTRTA